MTNSFRLPAAEISLSEAKAPDKIQLFRVGKFHHPEYGVIDISPKLLGDIKKNYDAKVRGVDLALDYRHENDDIAAAWIKGLELSDAGMWAIVEWTPAGKQKVEDKEFRYISPEFLTEYTDSESMKDFGPVLLGAALTNRPFIKKMEPVTLSEVKNAEDEQKKLQAYLKSKIQKPEGGKKLMEKDPAQMSQEELVALVKELQGKLASAQGDHQKLMDEKKQYQEEKAMSEKKTQFAKLLSEKKAIPAQEEAFLKGDMVKFTELAKPLNLEEKGNEGGGGKEEGSVDDRIVKLAEEKLTQKKAKDRTEAISMVLAEREDLRKEKYGR